ncbi:MAG: hypothetical protein AAF533_04650 [Acidobacteriota bacterium]
MASSYAMTADKDANHLVIKTLLVSDLVDSTALVEHLGESGAADFFRRHDRLARDLMAEKGGREIDKTDGFLVLFERPMESLRYAIAYQEALTCHLETTKNHPTARIGVHLGEVVVRRNSPEDVAMGAKPIEVDGLAKLIAARMASLAGPGQILLSRPAYDMARRATRGDSHDLPPLWWHTHGFYELKGVTDPVEVCEAGIDRRISSVERRPAPARPRDAEKARRIDVRRAALRQVTLLLLASAVLSLAVFASMAMRPIRLSAELRGRTLLRDGTSAQIALKGNSTLHSGEEFWIEALELYRPAHVHVFLFDSSGSVLQLFPSSRIPLDQPLTPGSSYRIPETGGWILDSTPGYETVILAADSERQTAHEIETLIRRANEEATRHISTRGVTGLSQVRDKRQAVEQEVLKIVRGSFAAVTSHSFVHTTNPTQ